MITEIITPHIEATWLPWAVLYFFFIGISVTSAFIAAWRLWRNGNDSMVKISTFVMLTTGIVAPIALLADLHQPARFWHFFAYFTPWSWMSIGAFILPVFQVSLFVFAWLVLRPALLEMSRETGLQAKIAKMLCLGDWQKPNLLVSAAVLMVLAGVGIMIYTGSEVFIVKSRPLWHNALWPFLMFFTACIGASSLGLLFSTLWKTDPSVSNLYARLLKVSSLLSAAIFGGWLVMGASSTGSAGLTFAQMAADKWLMILVQIMVLFGATIYFATKAKQHRILSYLTVFWGLSSCWWVRWVILLEGQTIPKYGAGSYHYAFLTEGEGLMGIIGVLGLWLFIAVVLFELLPWQPRLKQEKSL